MDAHDVFWLFRWMLRPLFRSVSVHRTCGQIIRENPGVVAVPRFMQILDESLEIMEQTTNPGTFFSRYGVALDMAERIIESSFVEEHVCYAEEICDRLLSETDGIAVDFVDRCRAKGNLWFVKEELFANETVFSEEAKEYLTDVLTEIKEECPPTENGLYCYCSVAFSEGGKTYYYKTQDSTLSCGDEVIVPVGCNGEQSIGVITDINLFTVEDAPFPPSVTKEVLYCYRKMDNKDRE